MAEKEEAESSVQDETPEVALSQTSVFLESELAFQLIEKITITTVLSQSQARGSNHALSRIRQIFDKYLDLPSLMDKHIGRIVSLLTKAAQKIMASDLMDQFWDTCLPRILSALYALSKVRGRKRVQKFLPHTVDDVEVVFEALRKLDALRKNNQSQSADMTDGPQLWESFHTLWNWVGMLSLVPFKSSIIVEEKQISDMMALGKTHLTDPGPIREMAASCLASWLSRPEFEKTDLVSFVTWSCEILGETSSNRQNIFLTMGCLQTLVSILKTSKANRETLISLMKPLWNSFSELSESNPSNLLLRKNLIKWWTRLGCAYLPPRVASWRYQRGRRSLMGNLSKTKSGEVDVAAEDPPSSSDSQYDFFFVPDEVEEAMGRVIGGLTDPSTIVRWSAAKGVGRIAERLPKLCGEDIVDALLELLDDVEKDNDWHGTCLAFAELARRGLLLPHRFAEVIPKISQALHVRCLSLSF